MNKFKEKKELIILADVPPIPTEERLIKYKEAGFNYYNLTEDYIVRDNPDKTISDEYYGAIDRCKALGLKVMLRTMNNGSIDYYDNVTDEFMKKGVDGYYITDEPSLVHKDWYCKHCMDDYIKLVDYYNTYGGDSFFHINLLQDYGMPLVHGRVTAPNYEDYLDHYIENILKKVKGEKSLATDHYPMAIMQGIRCVKPAAIRDYFRLAQRTKKLIEEGHDVRTGFCIQLVSDKGLHLRNITKYEEVLFQVNLALTFGAKLLEYYIYANKGYAEPGTAILCDMEQTVYTECYDFVKNSNAVANALASDYLPFNWVQAKTYVGKEYHDNVNGQAYAICREKVADSLTNVCEVECSTDTIISEFADGDRRAYMVFNYSEPFIDLTDKVTLTITDAKKVKVIIGSEKKTMDTVDGKISLSLTAGQAAFIIVE